MHDVFLSLDWVKELKFEICVYFHTDITLLLQMIDTHVFSKKNRNCFNEMNVITDLYSFDISAQRETFFSEIENRTKKYPLYALEEKRMTPAALKFE